ncbi:hypothetical protein FVW20_09490 [Desulfovibrio oxamicus]|uniref:Uncharacterized protein n=1 Tax=Nitratidesulfovibrio oxamicus TaxID=32016 RepID=A0ABS0J4Z8_9BACT|nr:hypothetical protein [Nitratidesulfovibrio oxamicus]MBG3877242.1 hypothetical protein [Nitratidesulfovibrio oxamicus]
MGASVAVRNAMLSAVVATHLSLHSADPGDTGANELSGGSPAYARKAVTLGAAADGVRSVASLPTFDVPAGAVVSHWSLWNGSTWAWGGPFLDDEGLPTTEPYNNQGFYTPKEVTLPLQTPDA